MSTHDETARPVTGTDFAAAVTAAIDHVTAGDWRARTVTLGHRSGTVTPHHTPDGALDADDLTAQIYALVHDLPSNTGDYSDGMWNSGTSFYYVAAPRR